MIKVKEFEKKGITVNSLERWTDYEGKPKMKAVFRSNGLLGVIRTNCYDKYSVDVRWSWWSGGQQTLYPASVNTIKQAKEMLFNWFKEKGFVVPKEITDTDWNKDYLSFPIK